jgi:two-component system alkaline phosphatase synthesis response regulator PhoP
MGKSIMLVDDDQDFLEQNRALLEARGYRVACFSDPGEALANLRRERPELVVTDLMMKNLDSGFSLARAIKSEAGPSPIPVILVTAVASQRGFDFNPRTREELAAMNADAFFDKPVAPAALIAKVEELLT